MPKLPDGNGCKLIATAKGRNGYFRPDRYAVHIMPDARIDLDIYSRSPARSAPLTIGLTVEQWRAVIADLEKAVS